MGCYGASKAYAIRPQRLLKQLRTLVQLANEDLHVSKSKVKSNGISLYQHR